MALISGIYGSRFAPGERRRPSRRERSQGTDTGRKVSVYRLKVSLAMPDLTRSKIRIQPPGRPLPVNDPGTGRLASGLRRVTVRDSRIFTTRGSAEKVASALLDANPDLIVSIAREALLVPRDPSKADEPKTPRSSRKRSETPETPEQSFKPKESQTDRKRRETRTNAQAANIMNHRRSVWGLRAKASAGRRFAARLNPERLPD